MPYGKSIAIGIILFILVLPVFGSLPYKGATYSSQFKLHIDPTTPPITLNTAITKTANGTYEDVIRYKTYTESDSIREDFNGYGGINGTITNTGDTIVLGITTKHKFNERLNEYGSTPFGDPEAFSAILDISRYTRVVSGDTEEISLEMSSNSSTLVIRVLPTITSTVVNANLKINVRNYIPLYQYLTRVLFMVPVNSENFTITMSVSVMAGVNYEVFVGITPIRNFQEWESIYGNVQYRQVEEVRNALMHLAMSSSSRSKLMTGTAFGNLKEIRKGYYILRAMVYLHLAIEINTTMKFTRPGVSYRVYLRLAIVLIIALYLPIRIKREIEYILRK